VARRDGEQGFGLDPLAGHETQPLVRDDSGYREERLHDRVVAAEALPRALPERQIRKRVERWGAVRDTTRKSVCFT